MDGNLGFTYTKEADCYVIYRGTIRIAILRGVKAANFEEQLTVLDFEGAQQLMARLTGNYKRGNERAAKRHSRNRRS